MEDTDAVRGEEKYEIALQEDMHWLGLSWQEGPGVGGDNGPYAQSERSEVYDQYFETLRSAGNVYPCFCTEHELKLSRKAQAAASKPPRYNGKCRNLTEDEVQANFAAAIPATLRFRVPQDQVIEFEDRVRGPQRFVSDDIGDFIIRRSNGAPAFFFSNAVDDALMEVSLVVRGEDHLTNTPRQLMLLKALGLPAPDYAHIALVVGDDGAPLSKRNGSQSVMNLRDRGYLPQAIVNYLARLGHSYESNDFMSYDQLATAFRTEKLHRAPARFDAAQLTHWQREAVAVASDEALWQWINSVEIFGAYARDFVPADKTITFVRTIRGNIETPADAFLWAGNLFAESDIYEHEAKEAVRAAGADFFSQALLCCEGATDDFKVFQKALASATDKKGKALFMPLRAALTGEIEPKFESSWHDGPQLVDIWSLLGLTQIRRRLTLARDIAQSGN
jgi:glutamyl-tRNA synthetase